MITLVDDGSNDTTRQQLEKFFRPQVNDIINHTNNQGRAIACNTGFQKSNADILIILDADCIPQGQNFIQEHLKTLEKADISCGKLVANSSNHHFWDKYQREIVLKRENDYQNGNTTAFTTANLAIKRDIFLQSGGFDTEYKHYGFEDRDFLLRCQAIGAKIAYTPTAVISHDDALSLTNIARKMREAGQFTSLIFRKKHPDAYRKMSYRKIDLQLNQPLRLLWPLLNSLMKALTPQRADALINHNNVPYFLKKNLVRLVTSLHFMHGTHNQQP
jgi:GT2 family glycosyltransferase